MKRHLFYTLTFCSLFFLISCQNELKPEPELEPELTLTTYWGYPGDSRQIQGINIENVDWNCENEFVATVENGVVKLHFVGETVVNSTDGQLSFVAEVHPKKRFFEEPILDFGASKYDIKAKLGTPNRETDDALLYEVEHAFIPYVMYLFDKRGMSSVAFICKVEAANPIAEHLMERYLAVDVDISNYSAMFSCWHGKVANPTFDYFVNMRYEKSMGALLVLYVPVNNNDNANQIQRIKSLVEGNYPQ